MIRYSELELYHYTVFAQVHVSLFPITVVFLLVTFSTFAAGWAQKGLEVSEELATQRTVSYSFAMDVVSAIFQLSSGIFIFLDFRFVKFISHADDVSKLVGPE